MYLYSYPNGRQLTVLQKVSATKVSDFHFSPFFGPLACLAAALSPLACLAAVLDPLAWLT